MAKSISKAFTYMFKDSDSIYKLFIATMIAIPVSLSTYAGLNFKGMQLFDLSKISSLANLSSLSGMSGVSNLSDIADMTGAPAAPSAVDAANLSNLSHLILLSTILAIIASIASVILIGYYCKCTQNVINFKEDGKAVDLLPSWEKDFGLYTKIGILFSYGSSIALALPIFLFLILFIISSHSIVVSALPCLLWALFILFAFCAMWALFCTDFKPSSFLAYRKTTQLIMYNLPTYLVILCVLIAIAAILSGMFVLLMHSTMFVIAFSMIQTYFSMVAAYLLGAIFQVHPVKLFR